MWDKPPPGKNPPLRERNGDLIPLTEDFVYQVPSRAQRLDRCEGYGKSTPPRPTAHCLVRHVPHQLLTPPHHHIIITSSLIKSSSPHHGIINHHHHHHIITSSILTPKLTPQIVNKFATPCPTALHPRFRPRCGQPPLIQSPQLNNTNTHTS